MGETQGFKVRVGVILPHQGKILLVRQNHRNFWVFPGGTLEPDESLEECAIREIQEEANLEISIQEMLYVADFITPHRHAIDVFFLGQYLSGELKMEETENLDEIGFFSLEAFKEMAVEPRSVAQQVTLDFSRNFQSTVSRYLGKYGG
jgi:8-oxo-dGTP diphosphatase